MFDEITRWQLKNFGDNEPWQSLLGVGEEYGELAHSHLKRSQGIQGTPEDHDRDGKDAVGDIIIYLNHYCILMGWDMMDCLERTWAKVKKRTPATETTICTGSTLETCARCGVRIMARADWNCTTCGQWNAYKK